MLAAIILNIIKGLLGLLGLIGVIWFAINWLRRTKDDVSAVIIRWIATAVILGAMVGTAMAAGNNGFAQIAALLFGAVCGLVLAILWVPTMCDFVGSIFASVYDGGSQEMEPQPMYSIAEARRKRGHYRDAVAEVRKQLEKFPTDLQGHLMLAEIQAENLNDLDGAQMAIEQWLAQPEVPAPSAGLALNRLADFHLKVGQDVESARQSLERIIERFPDSEQASLAAQRIAHLGGVDRLVAKSERAPISLRQGVENIGLRNDTATLKPAEEDATTTAGKLVAHLNEYPADNEAREKLAVLYAEHFQRLELAIDQVEQMIASPNQPMKHVVHWLNLLTDFHIKLAGDLPAAQASLQRVTELYPNTAPAENARQRLAHLKLELRSKQKSQAVKLGSYKKNVGLNSAD